MSQLLDKIRSQCDSHTYHSIHRTTNERDPHSIQHPFCIIASARSNDTRLRVNIKPHRHSSRRFVLPTKQDHIVEERKKAWEFRFRFQIFRGAFRSGAPQVMPFSVAEFRTRYTSTCRVRRSWRTELRYEEEKCFEKKQDTISCSFFLHKAADHC